MALDDLPAEEEAGDSEFDQLSAAPMAPPPPPRAAPSGARPPASPPAPARKPTLSERVKAKLSKSEAPKLDEPVRADAGPAKDVAAAHRFFQALLKLFKERFAALEFTVHGADLKWAPTKVRVETKSGHWFDVEVDVSKTTTPFTAGPGMSITLALKLPLGVTELKQVELTSGDVQVTLSL